MNWSLTHTIYPEFGMKGRTCPPFYISLLLSDCESSNQATPVVFNPMVAAVRSNNCNNCERLTSVYHGLTRRLYVIAGRGNLTAVVMTFIRARLLSLETHREE